MEGYTTNLATLSTEQFFSYQLRHLLAVLQRILLETPMTEISRPTSTEAPEYLVPTVAQLKLTTNLQRAGFEVLIRNPNSPQPDLRIRTRKIGTLT